MLSFHVISDISWVDKGDGVSFRRSGYEI